MPTSLPSGDEAGELKRTSEDESREPDAGEQATVTAKSIPDVSSASSSSSLPSSPPQPPAGKFYSTTAEAIANFRPSSREVVRGIAPHVFDERKRRRSHPRSRSRSPKPYWYTTAAGGEMRPSPLRGATVISWDEHSIYLEQPDTSSKRTPSIERKETALAATLERSSLGDSHGSESDLQGTTRRGRRFKTDKAGWKHFRVDIRLLKSIGVKLKSQSHRVSICNRQYDQHLPCIAFSYTGSKSLFDIALQVKTDSGGQCPNLAIDFPLGALYVAANTSFTVPETRIAQISQIIQIANDSAWIAETEARHGVDS
ncbi:hypothetical protein CVT26_015221 [Gymnopilus dilepis]|uniref:Uncharacterized protein n=1 Tax=Gymnopilus dilepis TaxID=231916 RepID=A0A409W426_9AGAR|nr:hypothetical protein CVT26_015221 [Gymnopilus dilepis]